MCILFVKNLILCKKFIFRLAYLDKIRDNVGEINFSGGFFMAFCEKCGKEIPEGSVCADCSAQTNANSEKSGIGKILDTKDTTNEYTKEEIEKNKVVCGLAYIPILFWLPLVAGTKGSKYCKFHSNNGLLILILDVIISIVGGILGLIPIVGLLTSSVLGLIVVAYIVFGMVFTFQGKVRELPFIGGIKIIS